MAELRGLLADAHADRMLRTVRGWIESLDLAEVLDDAGLRFVTFADVSIPTNTPDRPLWERCQADGWVLLTDNRNADGPDSLQATLADRWRPGDLPVLTAGDADRLRTNPKYAARVATDVADVLYGLHVGDGRFDQAPRLFLPRVPLPRG